MINLINSGIEAMLIATDQIPFIGWYIRLLFSLIMTGTIKERVAAVVVILVAIYAIKKLIQFVYRRYIRRYIRKFIKFAIRIAKMYFGAGIF